MGTIGYCYYDHLSLTDAAFNSLLFYFLNNGNTPDNYMVEIARWTAPIVTASWILSFILTFHKIVHDLIARIGGRAVAVYGQTDDAKKILTQLGMRGIACGVDAISGVKKYILLGSEDDNLRWMISNNHMISDEISIFSRVSSLTQRKATGNLYLFNENEIAARLYWKERFLYPYVKENAYKYKIVFLNFNALSKELLKTALQMNIFSPKQILEYHVFGAYSEFKNIYHGINRIKDTVIYHDSEWHDHLDLLSNSDRIIICDDISLAMNVLFSISKIRIELLLNEPLFADTLDQRNRIDVYPYKATSMTPEHIINEDMLYHAKMINLAYANMYSGIEKNEKNLQAEWNKLNTFTKYSNISSADYHEMQRKMLEYDGYSIHQLKSDEKLADLYSNLEHIRWCRYHYLNNWEYGVPPDGKNKDIDKRIHKDLIDYEELTAEEKKKDLDNVLLMFSIDSDMNRN